MSLTFFPVLTQTQSGSLEDFISLWEIGSTIGMESLPCYISCRWSR